MCEYSNQILKIDGKGTFLEVVSDMMPMGKIQLNFCSYNANNQMDCMLPFYLGETESIALATELVRGTLKSRKAGNAFYEKSGGSDKIYGLKKWCPWLKDGMHVSRRFSISASTKYEYLFKVEYGIGHKDGNLSVMDKVEKYIQIPITWEAADALGQKILMAWQSYNTLLYTRFADKLFPEMRLNLFEPDHEKAEKPVIKAEVPKETLEELSDVFLVTGKVESGDMKGGKWYKVRVQKTDGEEGELLFYPNQVKKVDVRFEKMLRYISENPVNTCKIPAIYSVGKSGGFVFKNFSA